MKRTIVKLPLLSVVVVGVALLIAGAKIRAAELPTVEIGLPEDGLFGLGGQYLIDKAIDRKHGFVLKPRWAGVADVERLVAIGAIPLGLSTSESAIRANLNNIAIRLIQPYQTPHNAILVRKDAPYKNLKDLKGKPFAVPPEVTSAYNNFDYIMRKQGISIEKFYQLKKLGAAGISTVLERGEVEAGYSWEAHVSKLLATGKYRVLVTPREEMNRLLNTEVKTLGWIGGLQSWISKNQPLVPKIRAAWQEMIKGVQQDEEHFRKHAKRLFGLDKPEELKLGWSRTRQFLLPPDFAWPDKANLDVEKKYLKESVELGIFPKEAAGVIDTLFVP
ncbi:MAG: PhnD/SsuA/transferrin family substrate-binding protein [Deltaproteobacteria bacterium]|nr:PhnD/SsuA/transferrin family substrate-binding protein [Deltaproteobacteria bacterium]